MTDKISQHGFQPKTCRYLKDQLYRAIKDYCLRLESKMNIALGQSTYAYMIADPLAILGKNEVHLGFSSAFHDSASGFDQSMLHDVDVLVARSPAHLPSDIQKVTKLLLVLHFLDHRLDYRKNQLTGVLGSRCFQARVDDVQRCHCFSLERLGLFG